MKNNNVFTMVGMAFLIAMATKCCIPEVLEDGKKAYPSKESHNDKEDSTELEGGHCESSTFSEYFENKDTQPLIEPTTQKKIMFEHIEKAIERDEVVHDGEHEDKCVGLGIIQEDIIHNQLIDEHEASIKNARLVCCKMCSAAPLACMCRPVVLTCRFAKDLLSWATCDLCYITCCPRNHSSTSSLVWDHSA